MAGTPQEIAQDWANRLGASADKARRGIAAVQTAPGAAAARQADVWASNTAASKPKFARNVAAVTLGDWQTAASTKGVDRMASGATAAVSKMASFLTKFLPFVMSAKASLPPRGSYEANKARMNAMVDKVHGFQK